MAKSKFLCEVFRYVSETFGLARSEFYHDSRNKAFCGFASPGLVSWTYRKILTVIKNALSLTDMGKDFLRAGK